MLARLLRSVPIFLALLLCTPALQAQSAADRATARALAYEGQAAFERGDYETAEDRFARADALVHAPTLLLALARSQAKLGKLVQASESYNRIIREGVADDAPQVFRDAVADAEREVEEIAPRLAWVTIEVQGAAEPDVVLDDAEVPNAALGVRRVANPGSHRVRASAPGFEPVEEEFFAGEGEAVSVTLELHPMRGGTRRPSRSGLPASRPRRAMSPSRAARRVSF